MKPATLLLPFVLVPIPAAPDIVPSGMHGVAYSLTVDAGAFAASLCRQYTVASGDTLEAIAKRECGDAACVGEIRLLNLPETTAKLEAGATIVIPPRAATADSRAASRPEGGAATQWVFFHKANWTTPAPILANKALVLPRAWPSYVVAVTRGKLASVLRGEWTRFDATEGAAISDVLPNTRYVSAGDPAWRVEATAVLKEVKDGRVLFEVSQKRFDEEGKLLADAGGRVKRGSLSPAILIVTAAALLAMVRLGSKRRRPASPPLGGQ